MNRFTPLFAVGLLIFATATQADIFQWEYINPADPSQGKQQSTTLAPDGADVDAVPGADIRGANFGMVFHPSLGGPLGTGITLTQLYSTASYQEHDLRGVSGVDLSNAITTNLIFPNGHLDGLDLDAGELLVVRDYAGNPFGGFGPIPIAVDQQLAMGPDGTLRMVFEADAWDSTISFAPGIPVALGGTLELTFAADVNLASQIGRTFDLFNWDGVTPTGAFEVSSPYCWDLSNLYTTGEVTLTAVPEPTSLLSIFPGVFLITQTLQRRST